MADRDELGKTVPRSSSSGAVPVVGAREELPTQQEGRYAVPDGQVDPELGRGGMGRVITLVDTHLRREVAVKELLPEHGPERSSTGPLLENLFLREARVLARLEHPGVVPVYELGRRPDGTPYYSMRKIRGRSLAKALEHCVSLDERLSLLPHLIDVVQTVGYAHSRGVVHRDLKPENVMVSAFGETQVIDWGLALVEGEPVIGGLLAGTPSYMPPEVAADRSVDARSDVWALGVMLYELLTGRLPFEGESGAKILDAVQRGPLPSVKEREAHAPPALIAVVDKALQRDPSLRYQNAGAMADALEAAQRARAPRPVKLLLTTAALAVLCLGLGGWAFSAAREVDDARRDARIAVNDAQRASADAQANAALAALREGDTLTARRLAEAVPAQPLARGVRWLAEERGVPEKVWSVKVPAGCAALATAGDTVACATLNAVALFGPDGAPRGELSTGPRGWQRAVLALDEHTLVSGGDDQLLHFWDPKTLKELRTQAGFASGLRALAADGEGGLVVGLFDGSVLKVGRDGATTPLTTHPRPISAVAAVPGEVASVSEGLLRVDGFSPMALDRHVGAVAFVTPKELVLGVERSVLVVNDGEAKRVSAGHRDDVTALVVVPAGNGAPTRLVSGSADGTVRWWHENGTPEGMLPGFAPGVQALAATADGLLVVANAQRALEGWKLPPRRRPPDELGVPSAHELWPEGGLVTGYRDGRLRRLDPGSGEVLELEARHSGPVRAVARVKGPRTQDGLRFLSAGDDGRVLAQFWNGSVETLDAIPGAALLALATSPDGAQAAWSASDGARVVWSLAFNKEVFREQDTLVRALAFSPDGRVLAAGREDKHVALLDAQTGKPQRLLGPLDGAVSALAFSPDGATLAVGGQDGRIDLWSLSTFGVLRTWNQPGGRIRSLAFAPTGGLLAAGSDDGAAWVFSPEHGALVAQVPADAGDVLLVAFGEGELWLAGSDRVVHRVRP